jgi:nucleoside-diphosphate-sugar epimerase
MKCLVTGGYGFIGRGVVQALLRAGHDVTGAGRDLDLAERLVPTVPWIYCDFNHDLNSDIWADRLVGYDVVVNCVGILQSDLQDDAQFVHGEGAKALFQGAETAGIKRLIHISATTLGREEIGGGKYKANKSLQDQDELLDEPHFDHDPNVQGLPEYATSKLTGEHYLEETKLNWTIIRPDLVLGAGSIGGAALIQGLAGLPKFVPLPGPGTQSFQPIALDDLADGIVKMIAPLEEKESKVSLEEQTPFYRQMVYAVGQEVVTLKELIQHYRVWLGFSKGIPLIIPRVLMKPVMWVGDFASLLGNRGPIRTASLEQMDLFAPHDGTPFRGLLGRPTLTVPEILALHQSTAVERQFARCYFLLPLLRWVLGLSWIFEGVEGLQRIKDFAPLMLLEAPAEHYKIAFVALLTLLCGVMFLSKPWIRVGGVIKSLMIIWAGALSFVYVSGLQEFFGWFFSIALPLLLIWVLMGLHEKR